MDARYVVHPSCIAHRRQPLALSPPCGRYNLPECGFYNLQGKPQALREFCTGFPAPGEASSLLRSPRKKSPGPPPFSWVCGKSDAQKVPGERARKLHTLEKFWDPRVDSPLVFFCARTGAPKRLPFLGGVKMGNLNLRKRYTRPIFSERSQIF